MRESWEAPRERAPIPHADLLTLRELATQAGAGFPVVASRLEVKGIKDFSENTLVRDLAGKNQISAHQLYDLMTATPSNSKIRSDIVVGRLERGSRGMGSGAGRKTLAEICAEEGLDLQAAIKRLEAKGLKVAPTLPCGNWP